jgi:hypothetical protein
MDYWMSEWCRVIKCTVMEGCVDVMWGVGRCNVGNAAGCCGMPPNAVDCRVMCVMPWSAVECCGMSCDEV